MSELVSKDSMAAPSNLASLLAPKTADTKQDPYSLFGLRAGERDMAAIASAIKSTITGLNEAKSTTDPAIWKQAALRLKEARAILADPQRKARLDRSLAERRRPVSPPTDQTAPPVVAVPAMPAEPMPPTSDPLAGLLPHQPSAAQQAAGAGGKPATVAPMFRAGRGVAAPSPGPPSPGLPPASSQPPLPPAPSPMPPPLPATAVAWTVPTDISGNPLQGAVSGDSGATPIPSIQKPVSLRRRKSRFPWVGIVLTLFTVACLGGIVGMVYVLTQNPQGLAITIQPGGPALVANDNASAVSAAAPEMTATPRAPRQPVDPIMGSPGQSRSEIGKPLDAAELTGTPSPDNAMKGGAMKGATTGGDATDEVSVDPGDRPESPNAMPEPTTPAPITPLPAPNLADIPGVVDPTPQQLETATKSLEVARQSIRQADWDRMETLAAAAVRDAATADQKAQATRLEQLAELAAYYHGGIQKGLDGLAAGQSFNVTDSLQVVVVEIGPQKVTIRFNGRNKEYPRGELPLVIAERVARFALPTESPSTAAAAEVYKSIASITTPQYRQAAVRELESMEEVPDELSPPDLVAAIKDVFGE